MVIATKCGLHWDAGGPAACTTPGRPRCGGSAKRACGGWGPTTSNCSICTRRTRNVPVAESAGELRRLLEEGKTRAVGASNLTLAQLEEFAAECPLAAFQPPYNMLMRQIEADTLPWCRRHGVAVMVYWPLMKGLLAGKIARDQVFGPDDSRRKYPMFQGEERRKNHDLVDRLASNCRGGRPYGGRTGDSTGRSISRASPPRCAAPSGPIKSASMPAASGWQLTPEQVAEIDQALAERGPADVRLPV